MTAGDGGPFGLERWSDRPSHKKCYEAGLMFRHAVPIAQSMHSAASFCVPIQRSRSSRAR